MIAETLPGKIVGLCAREFGVDPRDVVGRTRRQDFVKPRQAAMWFVRKHTQHSLPIIGRIFGGRDHTTAMWGIDRIEWRLRTDPDFAVHMFNLKTRVAAVVRDDFEKRKQIEISSLPLRIPASMVCQLAGYGRNTLYNRIKQQRMPAHVDQGKELLFDTQAVLSALGISPDPVHVDSW